MKERNGHENGWATLKGKVALVTGAAQGIGRAIALELAHRGASVAISYRTKKEHAESLGEQIRELGAECMLVQGDVANKEDARHIVQSVLDTWKRLDILVNNAGITRDKSLRKAADDEWADVINVNLNGTYHCTSAALPAMMEQKFGRIINITSNAIAPGFTQTEMWSKIPESILEQIRVKIPLQRFARPDEVAKAAA